MEEDLLEEQLLEVSPLKDTTDSLSQTSRGQIIYDRSPLSPTLPELDTSSGLVIPESVFRRNNNVLLFEESRSFEESPIMKKVQQACVFSSSNTLNLNHFSKWQAELAMRRSPVEETTPVYNISHWYA